MREHLRAHSYPGAAVLSLAIAVLALGALAGCGDSSDSSSGDQALVLYSSQHEPMTEALVEGFEERTEPR